MNELEVAEQRTRWNGRHVVVGMFLFGITMVGALWLYWELYTRPFRPLQIAINAEFPGCSPRVIGGREKSHRGDSPATLRIIIRVNFDPTADTARAETIAAALASLAQKHHDVSKYDIMEIDIEHQVPEQGMRFWSVSKPVAEWRESLELRDES